MTAVWAQMDPRQSEAARKDLIRLVGERLFEGYEVKKIMVKSEDLYVTLVPRDPKAIKPWGVECVEPSLPEPLEQWFVSDVADKKEKLESLVNGVPLAAFSWGDQDFREEVESLFKESLPGWGVSLSVRMEDEKPILKVGFYPIPPLILAVQPALSSSSIPTMIHSELKTRLLTGLSPLIGLPVAWVRQHDDDLGEWVQALLSDRRVVVTMKAKTSVRVEPKPITNVNVEMESTRYTVWAWAAAYAGNRDRFPEVGLHVGRKAQPVRGWDVELYGEWVVPVDDWTLEGRYGFRWSFAEGFWIGLEKSSLDHEFWWRLWTSGGVGRPYTWARLSDEGTFNGAIGWRVNGYLSLELYYDERDSDSLSLRVVGNL